jgi:drug/metabolite transporter (DMT)-like permease
VTSSLRGEARGLALVALSTVAYGVQPILGKVAYAAGVRPLPLLAWRYVIAAALLALIDRSPRPPLGERLRLWGIGAVFVFNSIAYFMALDLLAALGAFAGCALTAGGVPQGHELPTAGVLWALAAALVYASYVVLCSRFGAGVEARALALHVAQVAALLCVGLALAGDGLALPRDPRAWLSVAGIGVIGTVVAMVFFLAGMALVGPTRASVLSALEVLVTLGLALALLGERLSPQQWAGAALILSAVAFQNLAALRRLLRRAT